MAENLEGMEEELDKELEEIRKQFRVVMTELEELKEGTNGGEAGEEKAARFNEKLATAQALKVRIEKRQALAALKAWGNQSAGSAVRAGFVQTEGVEGAGAFPGWSGEAIIPNEGTIPGITAEQVQIDVNPQTGRKSYKAGQLYATDTVGEAKLKTLQSGAYKDAFRAYLLSGVPGRSMKAAHMKVLQEGLDQAGGFWVPPDIRAELIKKMATITAIRNNAYAFTTGSNMVTFPKVVYTADDKYTAGTQFSWTAEAPSSDISEATNPIAGKVNIPVHTATCAVILTRAMIEDAQFDILGYISMLLGEAFALGEEDAFINGPVGGTGQPQGILNHPACTVADGSTSGGVQGMKILSGVSGAPTWQGIEDSEDPTKGILGMEGALPPQYENAAKWYASKKYWSAVRGLVDANKRPLWSIGDQYPNWQNGYSTTLLGYPVEKCQFLPVPAADSYSALFGDMSAYYIADRVGLTVEVLRELRALKDEVVVYARKRLGGQLVAEWRLKSLKLGTS